MPKKAGELLMANGKVVIDVILDDGSVVKGVANINRTLGGMGDTASKGAISIGKIASALGLVALASKGINLVRDALDGAIDRFDTLNRFPKVLQAVGFSADESQKAINEMSDHLKGLPTTLDSVAQNTQRIALITGDLQGATDTTLALNDAFLASGSSTADAERGLEQYVQMLSSGKVDMQSWRTLQETMPIALNRSAKAFGFTGQSAQTDFYAALQSGKITFDQFNKQLVKLDGGVGGLADLAKTSSGGVATSFTNVKTAVSRGVANILTSIDKLLTDNGLPDMEQLIDDFGKKFESVLNKIADKLPGIIDKIESFYEKLKPWMPLIKDIATAIGTFVLALATVNTIMKVVTVTTEILNAVLELNPFTFFATAAIVAIGIIIKYWTPITKFFSDLWNGIKSVTLTVWNAIKGFFNTVFGAITAYFKFVLNLYLTIFKAAWNAIKTATSATWNAIKTAITVTINAIKTAFTATVNAIKNAAVSAWNFIKNTTSSVWNGIKNTVINLVTGMKNGIISIWNTIKSATSKAFNAVVNFIKHPLQSINLKSIGKDIIQGLIDGIGSMAHAVWNKVKSIGNSIKNGLRGLLGIHSPSTWMRDMIGKNMMLGWQIGIDRQKNNTLKKAQEATDWMTPNVPGLSGFVNRMRNMAGSIVNIPAPISSLHGNSTKRPISAGAQAGSGGINQTVIINSPEPLSPASIKKATRTENRRLAMELRQL